MAPVAPFFLSLLAIAGVVEAGPLQPGRHMAPAVYNQGLAGHARRGLGKVLNRYYGDSQGLVSLSYDGGVEIYLTVSHPRRHWSKSEPTMLLLAGLLWDVNRSQTAKDYSPDLPLLRTR